MASRPVALLHVRPDHQPVGGDPPGSPVSRPRSRCAGDLERDADPCGHRLRAGRSGRVLDLSPRTTAVLVSSTSAICAWLPNAATVIVIGPLLPSVAREMDLNPRPLLILLVLTANSAGWLTVIGDPATYGRQPGGLPDLLSRLAEHRCSYGAASARGLGPGAAPVETTGRLT
jgi:hypothetical protein